MSNGGSSANRRSILRPEARPIRYEHLAASQQDAFDKVLSLIAEAVDALPRLSSRLDDLLKGDLDPRLPMWIDDRKINNIAFLSGERGTGKTSLLLTMIEASLDPASWNDDAEVPESTRAFLRRLHEHVVWLAPLDLEPLPGPTNLLGAILTRIEQVIHGRTAFDASLLSAQRGHLDPAHDNDQGIWDLHRLKTDAALAWEGNLPGRGQHLDPEVYATEVSRAEEARLGLNDRLTRALEKIARDLAGRQGSRDPLFVLPIDDFDSNPARCLELLKLLRMIATPRLFTVVLGNVDVAENIFQLSLVGELTRLTGNPSQDLSRLFPELTFNTIGGGLSGNVTRKLIPPRQRAEIEPMKPQDAMGFFPRWLAGEEGLDTISDLLGRFEIQNISVREGADPDAGADPIRRPGYDDTLLHFITTPSLTSRAPAEGSDKPADDREKNELEKSVYSARFAFNLPQRQVADLWLLLNRKAETFEKETDEEEKKGRAREATFEVVQEWFDLALREEPDLSPSEKRDLSKSIISDYSGGRILDTTKMQCDPLRGPQSEITFTHHAVSFMVSEGWRFLPSPGMPGEGEPGRRGNLSGEDAKPIHDSLGPAHTDKKLTDRTAAVLLLMYDLFALRPAHGLFEADRLVPEPRKLRWVATRWQAPNRVFEVRWLMPRWTSFWEFNFLRDVWKRAYHQMRLWPKDEPAREEPAEGEPSDSVIDRNEMRTEYMLYAWIATCTQVLLGPKAFEDADASLFPDPETLPRTDNPWTREQREGSLKRLAGDLLELEQRLAAPEERYARRTDIIHHWLIAAVCNLAPEICTHEICVERSPRSYPLATVLRLPDDNKLSNGNKVAQYIGKNAAHIRRQRTRLARKALRETSEGFARALFSPAELVRQIAEDFASVRDDFESFLPEWSEDAGTVGPRAVGPRGLRKTIRQAAEALILALTGLLPILGKQPEEGAPSSSPPRGFDLKAIAKAEKNGEEGGDLRRLELQIRKLEGLLRGLELCSGLGASPADDAAIVVLLPEWIERCRLVSRNLRIVLEHRQVLEYSLGHPMSRIEALCPRFEDFREPEA